VTPGAWDHLLAGIREMYYRSMCAEKSNIFYILCWVAYVLLWRTPGFEINDLGYIQEADEVLSVIAAGYRVWDPKWIYRNYNINADIWTACNFGGQLIGSGFEWNGSMEFQKLLECWTGGNLSSGQLSAGMLRGGPMMKIPGTLRLYGGFSSDSRKKLNFSAFYKILRGGLEKNSKSLFTDSI